VKLPINTRYAIRICCIVAESSRMLSISAIADRSGISQRTVENIHDRLRKAGITQGTVGSKGGIRLALPPCRICIGDIMKAVDADVDLYLCQGEKGNRCPHDGECAMRAAWRDITRRVREVFAAVSLEEMLRNYRENMAGDLDPARCVPQG
jgi:Rrf2 family protein